MAYFLNTLYTLRTDGRIRHRVADSVQVRMSVGVGRNAAHMEDCNASTKSSSDIWIG